MSCGQTTAIQPAERHIPLQPHAEPTAHWEYNRSTDIAGVEEENSSKRISLSGVLRS